MGFWNTVGKIASTLMEEGTKKQAEMQKKAGNQISDYERKVTKAQNIQSIALYK
ncbi:hypothetical protein QNH48_18665 [Neobacillus sp. YX16]|uniref:hypothetical protein n=1 Tax=Neobacillus sp. YX16 TaxID=3047874 RepID=UPI0024C45C91|nr:hypothetical protein [Neobacillus sp. YX16]WHZ01045.1 hypothetical protein QNH48_18665 [Neobacillus sp. YX16]